MTQFGNYQRDKIEDVVIYAYFQREINCLSKKSFSQPPNRRGVSCSKFDLHTENDGLEVFGKGN